MDPITEYKQILEHAKITDEMKDLYEKIPSTYSEYQKYCENEEVVVRRKRICTLLNMMVNIEKHQYPTPADQSVISLTLVKLLKEDGYYD